MPACQPVQIRQRLHGLELQRAGEHLVHMLHRNEMEGAPNRLVDILQITQIVGGQNHRPHTIADAAMVFFSQTANRQHPASERNLPRHGHILLYS